MAPKLGDLTDAEKKLLESIDNGEMEVCNTLLNKRGIRIDCLDEQGMTPLQHAAYKANIPICKKLLSRGADVNSSYHQHGYTALMFAALSGNKEVTQVMLEAGARVDDVNAVGRTATQMASFVGQHQVVALINNFFSKDDLAYYTEPRGLEKEPKLPPHLCDVLYNMTLINNLNPVRLSLYLQENKGILDESYKVSKLFDILCEKMMKQKFTNEVMAIKFHYYATLIRTADKSRKENNDENLEAWIKRLLRGFESDCFPMDQEKFIRSTMKDFPYVESSLLQQIVHSIAKVQLGCQPTALSCLTQGINGQRMASEDDMPCSACDDFGALKKCSACKMVNYCDQKCQKLHWFTHKKYCKKFAEKYKFRQEMLVKEEEERKIMEEEAKKIAEEEEKRKAEAEYEDKLETEKKEGEDVTEGEDGGKGKIYEVTENGKCENNDKPVDTNIQKENITDPSSQNSQLENKLADLQVKEDSTKNQNEAETGSDETRPLSSADIHLTDKEEQ